MHLFNVKQLFFRRRKYERVVGGPQDEASLDPVASPATRMHHLLYNSNSQSNQISGQPYHLSTQAQERSSEHHATSQGSSATEPAAVAFSSSSSIIQGFKMRPKLRMRKQKSVKLVSTSSHGPQLSQAAVQNFLQGPSQEDEIYNQQCRDLLRKLSARGNRVPGFI